MSLIIGAIDQGTTSTRLLLASAIAPRIVAVRRHVTRHPQPGWVEQDPEELLANIRAVIAEAGHLDAIGLANQGESCLAWDAETGRALSPVIVWQDSRTDGSLAALPDATRARITALSGLPVDPYFSASKLAWILENLPEARAALARGTLRLGTTDAFFLDRLAGRFVTDRATASRTGLMNLATGQWDDELCAAFGVPPACLPEIRPNIGDFGAIDGVPVRASIVDQQAALYGHGCRAPGEAKITFGTGAFALALVGSIPPDPVQLGGLLPTVAWDLGSGPVYAVDGGVYDVGSAVDWALSAGIATSLDDFARFEGPSALSRGLVFVPAFSGLAAPEWDRSAAPLILGLTADMTRRDLCQALLEGIALSTEAVVSVMAGATELSSTLSIDGGVSASPYFTSFLASALDRDLAVRGFAERTAWGVAQLVAHDLGASPPEPEQSDRLVQPTLALPDADRARFAEARRRASHWR
jgi:glycerol kinase